MPFTDPVFTHIKQMLDIFISKDVDEPIFEPSIHLQLEVGDVSSDLKVVMFPWFVFQNDLFPGARICQNMSEYVRICQNMSARMICFKVPEYVSLFPDYSLGEKAEEGQFAYSKPFQVMFNIIVIKHKI